MTIKPLGDKLLVTPYRRQSTASGRILLNEEQRNTLTGDDHAFWVIAVGPKVTDIHPKDRVICSLDHAGVDYLDGEKRGFIRLSQVLIVVPWAETPSPSPAESPAAGH